MFITLNNKDLQHWIRTLQLGGGGVSTGFLSFYKLVTLVVPHVRNFRAWSVMKIGGEVYMQQSRSINRNETNSHSSEAFVHARVS